MKKYVIVTFPEIQLYMDFYGFDQNACLANDEYFVDQYGPSAYFIEEKWLRKTIETLMREREQAAMEAANDNPEC